MREEEVLGLEVAVDDAERVRLVEARARPAREVEHDLGRGSGPTPLVEVLEVFARGGISITRKGTSPSSGATSASVTRTT